MFWRSPIEPASDGSYRVHLSPEERSTLRALPAEVRARLEAGPAGPDLRRLFPPAYEEDEAGEEEYRRLMHAELLSARRQSLRVLEETAEADRLSQEEAETWLGALNDVRLVLGTSLDVTEDLYENELDPRHPRAAELAVYLYLSWLQERLVEALAERG